MDRAEPSDRVIDSAGALVDLYETYLELLQKHGEEHHARTRSNQRLVYWQTRSVVLEEDEELKIVTVRTVPAPPDRDLNDPLQRVEFFEKRDIEIELESNQGVLSRLIVGQWGEGVVLYTFTGGKGEAVPFTRRRYDYYLRLAKTLREILGKL